MTKFVILIAIMTLNIKTFIIVFQSKLNNYAYVTMTSQRRWYWAQDYYNNKFSLLYSLHSCKIHSWSLRLRQCGVCQENIAQSSI